MYNITLITPICAVSLTRLCIVGDICNHLFPNSIHEMQSLISDNGVLFHVVIGFWSTAVIGLCCDGLGLGWLGWGWAGFGWDCVGWIWLGWFGLRLGWVWPRLVAALGGLGEVCWLLWLGWLGFTYLGWLGMAGLNGMIWLGWAGWV